VQDAAIDLLIRSDCVATESWVGPAAVLVRGGRVSGVVSLETAAGLRAQREIDATGQVVMPGGVDPHCHVALPLGAYSTQDSFASASLAALAGGSTTIVDFAIPGVGQHPVDVLEHRRKLAADSRCDYAFHGCVNAPQDDISEVVRELAIRGVRTIKLFTTYRDLLMVETDTIERVMSALREVSGLTYVHAEANDLVEDALREAAGRGALGAHHHSSTRPETAEEAAVSNVLLAAERMNAPVYFVHQSTPAAVDLVSRARSRGVAAFSETCPHYLALTSAKYAEEYAERYVCCPPLRSRATVEGLGQRLVHGLIDTVGSDHCCYDSRQKAEHADDVREMPNGLPGVETRLAVIFHHFVSTGLISLNRFVDLVAASPARLNGLYPRKGTLAPGSDADIVILDPKQAKRVAADSLHMDTDYSPYDGMDLVGWPVTVVARGRVVVDQSQLIDPGSVGEFVEAAEVALA
jgi:dihydropyrimidinase